VEAVGKRVVERSETGAIEGGLDRAVSDGGRVGGKSGRVGLRLLAWRRRDTRCWWGREARYVFFYETAMLVCGCRLNARGVER
jgi:hypothetical protein